MRIFSLLCLMFMSCTMVQGMDQDAYKLHLDIYRQQIDACKQQLATIRETSKKRPTPNNSPTSKQEKRESRRSWLEILKQSEDENCTEQASTIQPASDIPQATASRKEWLKKLATQPINIPTKKGL